MGSRRVLRVAEEIREHVATLFATGRISDPRLRGVTILAVKVSPDLQLARIYYSVFGEGVNREDAQHGLQSATGFLRRSLGEHLRLRVVPEIVFHFDESIERAGRITSLLNEISEERTARERGEEEQ